MNYGYDPTSRDQELSGRLRRMLDDFPPNKHGMRPYVEINGLYAGVRIRRITNYDQATTDRLIETADSIYLQVIGGQG